MALPIDLENIIIIIKIKIIKNDHDLHFFPLSISLKKIYIYFFNWIIAVFSLNIFIKIS